MQGGIACAYVFILRRVALCCSIFGVLWLVLCLGREFIFLQQNKALTGFILRYRAHARFSSGSIA